MDDYLERTYRNLRPQLELALSPGHFPVFTRAKNPNRLHGTRTGLTLDLLATRGAVDVPLWHYDDVPHNKQGYAKKKPSKNDVKIATKALKRCLLELADAWKQFRDGGREFVVAGISQLRPLEKIPEFKGKLKDSFTFYPTKWILKPEAAFCAVERAVAAAGGELSFQCFKTLVEDAASMSARDFYANETEEHRAARIQNQLDFYANETPEHRAARIQSQLHFYANETEEHRAARIQNQLDFYANETPEHRAARIQSHLDFAANESPLHRQDRVAKLKQTIEREEGEKRARRLHNLDASRKTLQRQAEIKAKYRFTIGARSRATIEVLRRRRFERRALETPEQQFQRHERKLEHIKNWKAARMKRTPEERQQESANRRAAWQERRPVQRAKKCQELLERFDAMDGCERGYHYDRLLGIHGSALPADPFGKVLLEFYDANPGKLDEDAKTWRANATAKLQQGGYRSQKAYEERCRAEKWGANHASMSRGEKLKLAYAKTREKKEEAAKEEEATRLAAGLEATQPKEKWASQRLYRERKKAERQAIARGEEVVQEPSKFAARGEKIREVWARKREEKAAAGGASSSTGA